MRITKQTPPPQSPVPRSLRRERRRWDNPDAHALALGCVNCADRGLCGGMHKRQQHYSCMDDCCRNPATCDSVCPQNLIAFIERIREIDGFDLSNIPETRPRPAPALPIYVPLVYHRNRRAGHLNCATAAVPLHELYSRRDGRPRYTSRTALEEAFRLPRDTPIVAVGSGRDKPIETWWGLSAQRKTIVEALCDLGIEAATSPNYSVFSDQPRYDDMYNIKRIGLAWQEFVAGQVPCGLHLNARTHHDYARLMSFIAVRPDVTDVAFEFATGAAWPGRRDFHHTHLARLAGAVRRPLRLFMIGGVNAISTLAPTYAQITYIDTSAFMNAMHRQVLFEDETGKLLKRLELTEAGAPVDHILAANVEFMRRRIERAVNASRATLAVSDSAPKPEIPENAPSAPARPSSGRAAAR